MVEQGITICPMLFYGWGIQIDCIHLIQCMLLMACVIYTHLHKYTPTKLSFCVTFVPLAGTLKT